MIELRNVSKSYQRANQSITIFKHLSATFESQKSHAIVGRSGSGKTTLLSLLSGLDRPDAGGIWIDGNSMTALDESASAAFRRDRIGIVFQQFYLMSRLTALENVCLPLELQDSQKVVDKKRAVELLSQVGLADRRDHFPSQLSGGECQRVAIARALITKPSFILADEPTGNLDDETSLAITQDLFRLVQHEQTTLVLVTHDKELAAHCDRVWKLEHGQLL